MTDEIIEQFKDTCRRGGGRTEIIEGTPGDTIQCITDHGKISIDQDDREDVPTKARGQSITKGEKVKMKATVQEPETAYYNAVDDRIIVGKKDGTKISIHNDKDDDEGRY